MRNLRVIPTRSVLGFRVSMPALLRLAVRAPPMGAESRAAHARIIPRELRTVESMSRNHESSPDAGAVSKASSRRSRKCPRNSLRDWITESGIESNRIVKCVSRVD